MDTVGEDEQLALWTPECEDKTVIARLRDQLPDVNTVVLLYEAGLWGFSESRTVLGRLFPVFADARDTDLDRAYQDE